MTIPPNKTKIVCTAGPASQSREVMEKLLPAGMNVARLKFSHGDSARQMQLLQGVRWNMIPKRKDRSFP